MLIMSLKFSNKVLLPKPGYLQAKSRDERHSQTMPESIGNTEVLQDLTEKAGKLEENAGIKKITKQC